MIKAETKLLTEKDKVDLLIWLSKPEARILHRIVSSRCKILEVEALNAAIQGSAGNSKLDVGNQKLWEAQRYKTFLDILEEILVAKEPFETVTLS